MQLNYDCIRDILLTVEKNTTFKSSIALPSKNFDALLKYTDEEILYHVRQLKLSDMLYNVQWMLRGQYLIQDLTPAAHRFLANTRKDETWKQTKKIANKLETFSLNALEKIAEGLATGAVNGYLANMH